MEGSTPDLDERFAEWYVWAKREVGTDNRVCLGAAQAAIEAIEGGADDQAARLAARRSVAGHGIALVSRITPRRRGYAEWYDWARRESGGSREQLRAAARAALERLDAGAGADEAARAARETLAEASAVGAAGPAATAVWPVARQVAPDPAPAPRPVPSPAGPAASPPHLPVTAATASPWPAVPPPAAAGAAPARVPAPSGPSAGAFPLAPSHAYASPLNRLLAFAVDLVLLLIGMVVVLFALAVLLLFWLASSGQDPSAEVQIGLTIALNVILLGLAGHRRQACRAPRGDRPLRPANRLRARDRTLLREAVHRGRRLVHVLHAAEAGAPRPDVGDRGRPAAAPPAGRRAGPVAGLWTAREPRGRGPGSLVAPGGSS